MVLTLYSVGCYIHICSHRFPTTFKFRHGIAVPRFFRFKVKRVLRNFGDLWRILQ
nr:MAG TPA: hypothetical protein [Caudoviricetes sp.]